MVLPQVYTRLKLSQQIHLCILGPLTRPVLSVSSLLVTVDPFGYQFYEVSGKTHYHCYSTRLMLQQNCVSTRGILNYEECISHLGSSFIFDVGIKMYKPFTKEFNKL